MSAVTTMPNATSVTLPTTSPQTSSQTALKTTNKVLYALILVLSLCGNSAMLVILGRKRRLKSQSNVLLLNMVIAELSVAITSIPFDLVGIELDGAWVYGKPMCKIVYPLQTLPYGALVFSISALSYYRYRGIVYPLKRNLGRVAVRIIIAVIWVMSLAIVVPYSVYLEYIDGECVETWSEFAAACYTVALFVTQYALPLSVIGYCYVKIAIKLCSRQTDTESLTATGQRMKQREARTFRAARMVISFVLVFAVCMFPHHVVWLQITFGKNASDNVYLLTFAYLFTFTSTFANPLVYFTHNPSFRKELWRYLRHCSSYGPAIAETSHCSTNEGERKVPIRETSI